MSHELGDALRRRAKLRKMWPEARRQFQEFRRERQAARAPKAAPLSNQNGHAKPQR